MDIAAGGAGGRCPKRRENAEWQEFAVVLPLFAQHTHIIFLRIYDSKNVLTYIFQPFHYTYANKFTTSLMEGSSMTHVAPASGDYIIGPLFFTWKFSG